MEKPRVAIVPAANPKEQYGKDLVNTVKKLYSSRHVNQIIVSGRGKQVEELSDILIKEGKVKELDITPEIFLSAMDYLFFSSAMKYRLEMFTDIHKPDEVELVCYVSQENQRDDFTKLAPKLLKGYRYEFHGVEAGK
jgi:hypothetical protein